ncbi:9128_t:CDS:2, partial [Gigaspora rosea]
EELENLRKKEIRENINRRCEIIKDNQEKMLRKNKAVKEETKDIYQPRADIKEEWFEQLNALVEIKEWYQILKELKNNKALGISNISYTMIKHASEKAHMILAKLAKACIVKGEDLVFYTDGSCKVEYEVGSQELGIGWVQVDRRENFVVNQLCLKVIDSEEAIKSIEEGFGHLVKKQILKSKSFSLIASIKDLIIIKKINLQLIKVQVHKGVKWNELADKLAKKSKKEKSFINTNLIFTDLHAFAPFWQDKKIKILLKTFIKHLKEFKGIACDSIKKNNKKSFLIKCILKIENLKHLVKCQANKSIWTQSETLALDIVTKFVKKKYKKVISTESLRIILLRSNINEKYEIREAICKSLISFKVYYNLKNLGLKRTLEQENGIMHEEKRKKVSRKKRKKTFKNAEVLEDKGKENSKRCQNLRSQEKKQKLAKKENRELMLKNETAIKLIELVPL